jgi:anaerobic ribonucleoside-triphosphate reductase activating protein
MSTLRLAAACRNSTTSGPGQRYVIWLQGCDKRCPGCISPEWQRKEGGMVADVRKLAADILSSGRDLTISGGEPLLQSTPLAQMLAILRVSRQNITVILYTGYTVGQIILGGTDDQRRVLSMVDLVIDGPYIEALNDDCGIRGSSNQGFHYITDALKPYRAEMENAPRQVTIFEERGGYFLAGVPPKQLEL